MFRSISPNRVHDVKDADIVVVPACLDINGQILKDFFDGADRMFPLIDTIPHVLLMVHPIWDIEWYFRG